ncbi:long-chain fatty acid--CoA ligase [candidate division KSB1 bacterium]|nr:long-chain fatty acid--CoA ligase [Candidatus Aminicenantes bacterium]RQW03615.1 MAG: long-chain fatty acid--CoA ligase [candidate division KSB1 bacterium]
MNVHIDKPWLKYYEPGVPHQVENPSSTLPDLLPAAAGSYPDRTALVLAVAAAGKLFNYPISYAKLHQDVGRFAASLQGLGVQKGDRVAIYLPNCPQFVIAFLAAVRIGAIAVPFNPLYSAREAEYQLKDCGAKVAVVLDRFVPIVQQVQTKTMLRHIVVTSIKEYFPPLLWMLYTLTKERKLPRYAMGPNDFRFTTLLRAGLPRPVTVDLEDTAVLLYTGGTTGVSKGVELSHRNLLTNAEQNRVWAGIGNGCETTLAAVPLFHGFGLTCCLNLGILTGTTIVLVPNPTDTKGLIQTIVQHQPTIFPVVPTMLVAISHFPGISEYNLRSIRVCPCAGSALAPAVQRTFIERTGVRPVEGYGLTEAAPVTHGNPPFGDDRHGTIGLPYPGTVARVVDFETGKLDMPFSGEWTNPGEIIIKGPQIMKGYWKRPEETAAQIRDGWLYTGDIGQMHRDGYFRIVDRLKDMIIRSGMNIYPAEVEAVLHEHPKVMEALVIGIPDASRGELVKAFVVPRDGVEINEDEILVFCRQNMAKYKVPAAVEIRAGLYHSAVGKPLRRALREELGLVAG